MLLAWRGPRGQGCGEKSESEESECGLWGSTDGGCTGPDVGRPKVKDCCLTWLNGLRELLNLSERPFTHV